MTTTPLDAGGTQAGSPVATSSRRAYAFLPALGSAWLVGLFIVAALPNEQAGAVTSSAGYILGARVVPCTLGILGLFLCLGVTKLGRPAGVLITQQNVISLSRLQMVVWTVLLLSFFAAMVFVRIASGQVAEPLNVAVSGELWGLLGISATSLVGTPLLMTARRDKEPVNGVQAAQAAATKFGERPEDIAQRAHGPLYVNPSPADARFSDIFEGDELSNTQMVDLAKVQMFVFTAVSALVWTIAMVKLLGSKTLLDPIVSMPTLPSGMVTLLGVSNAGYLLNKLVDHTETR